MGIRRDLVCERSGIERATIVILEAPVSRYSAFVKSIKCIWSVIIPRHHILRVPVCMHTTAASKIIKLIY